MEFAVPSPSPFPSSSQWARAITRPASAEMSVDMDVGVVRWIASQSANLALQKLIYDSGERKGGRERPKT